MTNPKMSMTELRLLNKLHLNLQLAKTKYHDEVVKVMKKYKAHDNDLFRLDTGEIMIGSWEETTKGQP